MKSLIPALVISLVGTVALAQVSVTKIKNFGVRSNATGVYPESPLLRAPDGTLYGTTGMEEGLVKGTLFKLQPDGSGFAVVKAFTDGSEGIYPVGQLAISGDTIYGTTRSSETIDYGKVFKVNTDGTGYTVLKEVTFPWAGVVLSGTTLYGWGFKIQTDGTGYTELAGFPWVETYGESIGLIVSGGELYGTTIEDGLYGAGTVFKVNTNGTGYTVLLDIAVADRPVFNVGLTLAGSTLYGVIGGNVVKINTDGTGYAVLKEGSSVEGGIRNPGLTYSGGVLYGSMGYPNGVGVFSINTDGTGYHEIKIPSESDGAGPVWWWTVSDNALYGVSRWSYQSAGRYGSLSKLNIDGSGFQILKEFTHSEVAAYPGPLVYSAGTLYGTTPANYANRSGDATVFKVNTDGTGYTLLRQVPDGDSVPYGRLTASGGTLYGTATGRGPLAGGDYSNGTVFRMNPDGTGYSVLKEFTELTDGNTFSEPGLVLSGNTLYGSLVDGLTTEGQLFKLNTDGTGFTVLHSFVLRTFDPAQALWTNSGGAWPPGELTVSGSTIYGTASEGGVSGAGTVFKLSTNGAGFTVLKHFTYPLWDTNSMTWIHTDGATPLPGLTLVSNTLFGVTSDGGQNWGGTIFKVNTDGTDFMVVKQFPYADWDPVSISFTNSDGTTPQPGLTRLGTSLYGTTSRGGHHGVGTLFKVTLDGTGFTVLKHLGSSEHRLAGTFYLGGLVAGEDTLYGTAEAGGDLRLGAIYRIDLSPTLSIGHTMSGDVAVSWPSVWTDYVLQQNTNSFNPLNWSNVTDTIQDDGTNHTFIVNPTDGGRIYRLVGP